MMKKTIVCCRTLIPGMLIQAMAGMAAPYSLQIRDTIGRSWEQEPINWELALQPGEFRKGPVLVQRDGKPIPAQIVVVERHPDGSARTAIVRLIIDKLDKDAATQSTAEFGKEGPMLPGVKISEEKDALVLDNSVTAVRVLNRN